MSTNPLASIADYETFIYGLPDAFASIQMSTLVVVHTGPVTAVVRGEIHFPPDIKHHRVLAPGLSFAAPNLPFLIREIGQSGLLSP